jgi:UDP-N-acetylmuramate dehydrogenase
MSLPDWKQLFESIRSDFEGLLEFDAPLSKVTYYRIGGPASVLATPKSIHDLELISKAIAQTGVKFFILGWGSNILFPDTGFDGVVIRLKTLFTEIEELPNSILRVGAGVGASTLLRKAQEKGYGGLECLTGIPGSVGGMVAMNAGTHLGDMRSLVTRIESVTLGLSDRELPLNHHIPNSNSFSYRRNHFLNAQELVTHVELKYHAEEPALVKTTIENLYQRRKITQPVDYPSCGSVFMNPKGKSGEGGAGLNAWQVIDQLGLRGHRIGDAQISEKHSNFIINLGDAKAADVIALIELAKSRAWNECGIELHEEVKIITG